MRREVQEGGISVKMENDRLARLTSLITFRAEYVLRSIQQTHSNAMLLLVENHAGKKR
jgi:hypothetical protein